MIRAVLFDLDGTLVDTMPLHFEAYRRAFERGGVELSRDDFYDNVGGKAAETIPRFLRGRPCALSVQELHEEKKRILLEILESADVPVLETAKLLLVFRPFAKMALVSSGSRPGIERIVDRLGWRDLLDEIVTGEDTTRGKPAPDPFLLAASRLGADARDCLVFEDTDDGVAGAEAAGMQWVDVRRMTSTGRPA